MRRTRNKRLQCLWQNCLTNKLAGYEQVLENFRWRDLESFAKSPGFVCR